jgi:hypothetical protein
VTATVSTVPSALRNWTSACITAGSQPISVPPRPSNRTESPFRV